MTTKIEVVEFRNGKFGVRKTIKRWLCTSYTFIDLADFPNEQNWRPASSKFMNCCQSSSSELVVQCFNKITTVTKPDYGVPVPMNAI